MLRHKQSCVWIPIFWARKEGSINMAQIRYMSGIKGVILEDGE
jgi:hypothetical protein